MDESFLGDDPSPWYTCSDEPQPEGFAHANLVHSVQQNLLCVVCYELPKAVNMCPNGHVICDMCLGRIRLEAIIHRKFALCPTCRALIFRGDTSRNEAMEQVLLETPEACAFCNQTYKRKFMEQHMEHCKALAENSSVNAEVEAQQVELAEMKLAASEELNRFLNLPDLVSHDVQLRVVKVRHGSSYFESSQIVALGRIFVLRVWPNLSEANPLNYWLKQVSPETELLKVKFCILAGPSVPTKINPKILCHAFNNRETNSPQETLECSYQSIVTTFSLQYPIPLRVLLARNDDA